MSITVIQEDAVVSLITTI